ncbi:tRNA (adenosine(37)-N6)-threonylcarbamoyltransferase complex transferase subunit TsaD [Candidatus Azambacteria bacterium RIFCSPLOWO2_01_FULL_37_9]|uniref:tRNA N6-adenosine threonylcarbamoyltransferase n=1 Tax=Candidatus Azambacteria bacterium RIFCSPLOWO2_01_FULL_37_9 TaxID=1797297 RepID=A0A1F5C7V8_9BACT|nr:MAG: putative tRNA threonylcarbamoyladenosine biosynthesis protein Gcp [Parcubacteria group bacterium GW2011_GWE2_37_8]OGD38922.1 MAG: tRNA (adenosine(37)-N6)-threonylcarbamoyltransferase complex transferase subunit TsaD [Candidatus Azambacteria bacterium RIFCSPLOWO2_01_FULL_37_9]
MIILAIETSCDDTSVAIISVLNENDRNKLKTKNYKLKTDFKVLANLVSSQINIHKKWGGVVPNLASRAHAKNLPIVFKRALKEANITIENIDAIAVTIGPGLAPSLLIGVHFARALAYKYNKPIIPINHINGHILSAFFQKAENVKCQMSNVKCSFPVMNLIVSGGHTSLYLMKNYGKYELIGKTRDDAAGEAFDKAAKMLGLGYPGGPVIAALAARQVESLKLKVKSELKFPRPMINSKDFDFSFSGLKTALFYFLKNFSKTNKITEKVREKIAHEFQQSVIDVLISKTISAAKRYGAKTIAISGGVSANNELRKQMEIKAEENNLKILLPPKNMTTDNALMIAIAGYHNRDKKTIWDKIDADPNLKL